MLDIKPSNISIIKDNIEMDDSANDIIRQSVSDAVESAVSLGLDLQSISEFIYFGDVNLTHPGANEYPTLLTNQQEFKNMIANYFPCCNSIKRILVSSDQTVLVDAEQTFSQNIPQRNLELPVVFDSFLNKSSKDLYTEIHRIDSQLIDTILTHYQILQTFLLDDDPAHGFLKTQDCIERLEDNFDYLYGPEGYPLTFHFIEALHGDFMRLSAQHASLIKKVFFIQESGLLPWAFSYLIPQSIREVSLHRLDLVEYCFSVMSVGDVMHHDLADILDDLAQEEETHIQQYFRTSDQLKEIIDSLLKKLNHESEYMINHQAYLSRPIQAVVDEVRNNLELLSNLLSHNTDRVRGLEKSFSSLKQRVTAFSNEAQRKRTLSNSSFFSSFSSDQDLQEGYILPTNENGNEDDSLAALFF